MPRSKQGDGPDGGRYVAVRDVALPDRTVAAGETVTDLDPDLVAFLIRDGMIRPEE